MNSTYARFQGVLFLLAITIPWPGPTIVREPCPRDKAALVRKVIVKRWVPILEKVGATLPLECPLNPLRDIFHPQQSKKLRDDPQWSCGFCGKSFYREEHLDAHMEKRHSTEINRNDDATCLADFCDIMRCEVLQEKLKEIEEESPSGKDVKFWNPRLISYSKKASPSDRAIQPALPRGVMRTYQPWPTHSSYNQHFAKPVKPTNINPAIPRSPTTNGEGDEPGEVKKSNAQQSCNENDDKDCSESDEAHNDSEINPEEQNEIPIHLLHSWKDTCSDENLAELRAKCQVVITQCISGLVLNLTLDQVKSIEMALQKTVCWYLTCDRYWESGVFEPPEFPWGIVCTLVFILTFGLSIVYYIVWVFFESNQDSAANTPVATENLPIVPVDAAEVAVYKRRPQSTAVGGSSSRASSLGRHSTSISRARFSAAESESECRDSGFNEGGLFPEMADSTGGYADYDQSTSSRLRHYSEDSRVSAPQDEANRYYAPEERVYNYASTFTPNYEQRRLKRNRYNYLDDFDTYSEFDTEETIDSNSMNRDRNDSFIYVSYPPEMKKKFMENR